MTDAHAKAWHAQMQPFADAEQSRADRNWDWPWYRERAGYIETAVSRIRKHTYECVTLEFSPPSTGKFELFGLAILVVGYGAIGAKGHGSVFLWYLSDAPDTAFKGRLADTEIPKACGAVLLDVAVVESFNAGYNGRVGLHAAPAGGQRLFQWYAKRGMHNLPVGASLPGARMNNDGRYFFYDPPAATMAASRFDPYR